MTPPSCSTRQRSAWPPPDPPFPWGRFIAAVAVVVGIAVGVLAVAGLWV